MSTDFRGGAGANYSGRNSVTVGSTDVRNLVIPLKPNGTIRGRLVTEVGPTRNILPPPKMPFTITLDPAGGDAALGAPRPRRSVTVGSFEATFTSVQPGEFSIGGVMPGKYWLRIQDSASRQGSGDTVVRTTGNPDWLIKSIAWKGRDYSNEPFDIAAADDLSDVVVIVTNSMPELSGSVRGSNDLNSDRAMMIAFPVEPAQWRNAGLWPARMKSASVSSTGTYQLSTLPAGDYFVAAIDRMYRNTWQDPALLAQIARSASRVTLTWGNGTTQNLTTVVVR